MQQEQNEKNVVDFDGPDDPLYALNWSTRRKVYTTVLYGLTTMTATWASSCISSGLPGVASGFHVSVEVATLSITLFLFGFGIGPLLWAPLSEVYGRKVATLPACVVAMCFSFGSATAKDIQTLMITRFFTGFFSSAPVANTGGVLGEMYSSNSRAIAMAGYSLAVVGGPVLGPIVGSALVVQPSLSWRWTEYITGILSAIVLAFDFLYIRETYSPVILRRKAMRLRLESRNWALHSRSEEWDTSFAELMRKFLIRPLELLTTPICFAVALYASFCYGILYMQLGAVPIIFHDGRGWPLVRSSLPFLSITVGALLGAAVNIYNQTRYNVQISRVGTKCLPEARLPPMMVGSVFFAAGSFITSWTAAGRFPWIAPCIGLTCTGFGFTTIFQAAMNYLIDTFQPSDSAASAVAANTFMRSCFAGSFPLVVHPMYDNLGTPWAGSLVGFISIAMIPIPFVFYLFGKRIRSRGKYSRNDDEEG
ncbi:uncharacterized protein PV06_10822 [Exophiala oligosperma]|uniref:Major facilitator superfamily (MFS) profile domain-containing protein n=2 Tax=Chaetothyriales TaxID=34395 RepID=A0A0D2D0V0_9EURO|nr:uncharacterized protein PV06_10822 [Exophiala oligosperma]KAJ9639721.1 hypothetical protein H2204_003514 [Knufia peltigerae]KIW36918.1 hypothetical protein PV06_10822 [Exophiala oligosperma]